VIRFGEIVINLINFNLNRTFDVFFGLLEFTVAYFHQRNEINFIVKFYRETIFQ